MGFIHQGANVAKLLIFSMLFFTYNSFARECFLGEISKFGGNFAPRGWALAQGQLLPINSNQSLFSIFGTIYGGDGRTTFALPDLRGRAAIHAGHGTGLSSYSLGQKSGRETVSLTNSELANHKHEFNVSQFFEINSMFNIQRSKKIGDHDLVELMPSTNTGLPSGGSRPYENMKPYLAVNYIICINGWFPSRN